MVLGVCRRLLHDPRDVEDAFQATFLVLLRKAGALRDAERLGPWLHGVAYRVAARIRSRAARRPAEESKGARPEAVESACDLERSELRTLIDEEIRRLPEKYRRPVVLCYLEGRTHEEAARRLRCSAGSVRGRLDRARQKLKRPPDPPRPGAGRRAGRAGGWRRGRIRGGSGPARRRDGRHPRPRRDRHGGLGHGLPAALELADGVFRAMVVAKLKLAALLIVGILALGALPLVVALESQALGGSSLGSGQLVRPRPRRPVSSGRTGRRRQGITVTGRVLDEDGTADRRRPGGARLGPPRPGSRSTRRRPTPTAGSRCAASRPARLILTVQARGHAPDLKSLTARPGSPPVEFRLGPGHTIRGRIVDAHDKPIAGAPIAADEWRGHHSLRWNTRTDAEGRFRWDDAPADGVLIDLGTLGFNGKRFWTATPDAPEKTITMRRAAARPRPGHRRRDRPADHGVHPGAGLHLGERPERLVAERAGEGADGPLLRRAPEHGGRARGSSGSRPRATCRRSRGG